MALRDPTIPTGNALIDALPADQKLHVMQLARAQAHEGPEPRRASMLKGRHRRIPRRLTCRPAPRRRRPSDDEIMAGLRPGARSGAHPPAARTLQALGQNIQQVKSLPDRDIATLVDASKPQPGEGYAQKLNDWKLLSDAAEQVCATRAAPIPIGFAIAASSLQRKADQGPLRPVGHRAGVRRTVRQLPSATSRATTAQLRGPAHEARGHGARRRAARHAGGNPEDLPLDPLHRNRRPRGVQARDEADRARRASAGGGRHLPGPGPQNAGRWPAGFSRAAGASRRGRPASCVATRSCTR
jgi:hypothetical protein